MDSLNLGCVQAAVVSCLIQSRDTVLPLIEEFDINEKHFKDSISLGAFVRAKEGTPTQEDKAFFDDYVPVATNSRYYITELYEHGLNDNRR